VRVGNTRSVGTIHRPYSQYGLRDCPGKGLLDLQYARHELLAITELNREGIRNVVLGYLAGD